MRQPKHVARGHVLVWLLLTRQLPPPFKRWINRKVPDFSRLSSTWWETEIPECLSMGNFPNARLFILHFLRTWININSGLLPCQGRNLIMAQKPSTKTLLRTKKTFLHQNLLRTKKNLLAPKPSPACYSSAKVTCNFIETCFLGTNDYYRLDIWFIKHHPSHHGTVISTISIFHTERYRFIFHSNYTWYGRKRIPFGSETRREFCKHDHILFNFTGNGNKFLCV